MIKGTKGTANVARSTITGERPWYYDKEVPNPYQEELNQVFMAIRKDDPFISDYMTRSTLVAIIGKLSC